MWWQRWRGRGAPGRGGRWVVCPPRRRQGRRLFCVGAVLTDHCWVTSSSSSAQRLLVHGARGEGGGQAAASLARTLAPPAQVHTCAGARPRQVVEAVALLLQAGLPHNRSQPWNNRSLAIKEIFLPLSACKDKGVHCQKFTDKSL